MKKKIFLFSVAVMLMMPMTDSVTGIRKVQALEMQTILKMNNVGTGIVPYADVIETIYRLHQGKVQYRRWNKTKGYWVDSDWITVG